MRVNFFLASESKKILESCSVNYILNIGKLRDEKKDFEYDKDSLTLTQLSVDSSVEKELHLRSGEGNG